MIGGWLITSHQPAASSHQKAILALARGCIKLFVTSVREHTGPIQLRLNHPPALVPRRERAGEWEGKRTPGSRLTY